MKRKARVGLIGTGFGRRVMLPTFAACEDAEVAAICSARRENAEAAAREYRIRGIYTDYEVMIDQEDLDLVLITVPPHLHGPMARKALQSKVHVLVEKPMAMNFDEAKQMYDMAEERRLLHLVDHELRFNPTLRKLKERIDSGYLGAAETVSFAIQWCYPMERDRPWGWWFDQTKGGGLLGALGSHQIDLLRWLLGEFKRVSGHLHTFVKERRLPDSNEYRAVTSDDYCSFTVELENGAVGSVTLDATARAKSDGERWAVAFHGALGSLIYDGQGRLWGLCHQQETEEFTQPDSVPPTPGLPEGIFPRSFLRLGRSTIDALQHERVKVEGAATFYDGMRVQAVLDAIRISDQRGSWEDCSVR